MINAFENTPHSLFIALTSAVYKDKVIQLIGESDDMKGKDPKAEYEELVKKLQALAGPLA